MNVIKLNIDGVYCMDGYIYLNFRSTKVSGEILKVGLALKGDPISGRPPIMRVH